MTDWSRLITIYHKDKPLSGLCQVHILKSKKVGLSLSVMIYPKHKKSQVNKYIYVSINQSLNLTSPRTNPASVGLLRTVQETIPEYLLLFALKTNTYHKDKKISEVQLCF